MTEGDDVSLTCVSGCPLHTTTVWFRDGRPVQKPVFQASREDAGKYYCAVLGQEMLRSASVPLNVQCEYTVNTFFTLDMTPFYLTVSKSHGSVTVRQYQDPEPEMEFNHQLFYYCDMLKFFCEKGILDLL